MTRIPFVVSHFMFSYHGEKFATLRWCYTCNITNNDSSDMGHVSCTVGCYSDMQAEHYIPPGITPRLRWLNAWGSPLA